MKFEYPMGATPLDPNEIEGLIPQHITLQIELNEYEQSNILKVENWISEKKFSIPDILSESFITKLHKKMFDDTWHWAGKFRKTEKNIGVDPVSIPIELKNLVDDVDFQVKNLTYTCDEISARFHHRLVAIHPFANGNGRHARLMSDILLKALDRPFFSWGAVTSLSQTEFRKKYIFALRSADKYDYEPLLEFVRS